jgi:hypothetical protein
VVEMPGWGDWVRSRKNEESIRNSEWCESRGRSSVIEEWLELVLAQVWVWRWAGVGLGAWVGVGVDVDVGNGIGAGVDAAVGLEDVVGTVVGCKTWFGSWCWIMG